MTRVLKYFEDYPSLRYVGFQTVPDYTTYAASKCHRPFGMPLRR